MVPMLLLWVSSVMTGRRMPFSAKPPAMYWVRIPPETYNAPANVAPGRRDVLPTSPARTDTWRDRAKPFDAVEMTVETSDVRGDSSNTSPDGETPGKNGVIPVASWMPTRWPGTAQSLSLSRKTWSRPAPLDRESPRTTPKPASRSHITHPQAGLVDRCSVVVKEWMAAAVS